jgi:hypothetical protein
MTVLRTYSARAGFGAAKMKRNAKFFQGALAAATPNSRLAEQLRHFGADISCYPCVDTRGSRSLQDQPTRLRPDPVMREEKPLSIFSVTRIECKRI